MKFARLTGNVVAEIIDLPDGVSPDEAFHPDIVNSLFACDETVEPGWVHGNGAFSAPQAPAIDIVALKGALSARVDTDAEAIRAQYITPGSGQAMAYIEKARQAAAYLAAEAPDDADYPLLVAEVGITGETVSDVATVVDTAYRDWIAIGGVIEAERLSAKKAIAAAEDADAAQAAYDAIEWPEAE